MPQKPRPSHSLPSHQRQEVGDQFVLIAGLVELVTNIGFDIVEDRNRVGALLDQVDRAAAGEMRVLPPRPFHDLAFCAQHRAGHFSIFAR